MHAIKQGCLDLLAGLMLKRAVLINYRLLSAAACVCVSSVRRAGRQPGEELSFIGVARGDDTDRFSLLAGSVH